MSPTMEPTPHVRRGNIVSGACKNYPIVSYQKYNQHLMLVVLVPYNLEKCLKNYLTH